jgi:AcrR family transcriptional regulator
VTRALLEASIQELAANGYEKTTISAIARRARTSKQAVYRRFEDKEALIAAAVGAAFEAAAPGPPQRGNVAADLRRCLGELAAAFGETPLGGAVRALVPHRSRPRFAAILSEAEAGQRLVMRQIFLATPFETDMEARIDLLLGLVYFRLLLADDKVDARDLETAIYLVLGLVAPQGPSGAEVLPGM